MTRDYKTEFAKQIEILEARTKLNAISREDRIRIAEDIGGLYALEHAKAKERAQLTEELNAKRDGRKAKELPFNPPDSALLTRLTDIILDEEISDSRPDKMTLEEYPIMSEFQRERRQEGKNVRKGKFPKGEVDLGAIMNHGTDGHDYRTPVRRKRTTQEYLFVDYENKSRNKARKKNYLEFTKTQPVTAYFADTDEIEAMLNGD